MHKFDREMQRRKRLLKKKNEKQKDEFEVD